jgi:hypothetical protein
MVEGRRKSCYMPKRSFYHGGDKQMFTKYARQSIQWVEILQRAAHQTLQPDRNPPNPPAKIVLQFKFRYYIEDTYNTYKYRIITILRDRRR